MIFMFHSVYFVIKFAIKLYRRQRAVREFQRIREERLRVEETGQPLDQERTITFDPPVYRQRYSVVQQVLLDKRWRKDIKKVVDFGCNDFGFFKYLRHLYSVNEILEVDCDEVVLMENVTRVYPLTADYLDRRSEPLLVSILSGNCAEPDSHLENCDAVVAIELIEHLYPDTLDALPFNVFGYVKPRVAIMTTPNADFNVLFPNFKQFRHADHKFEWTREQFQDWALNISTRFPQYSVSFEGIGRGPEGTESLGCCSQMAVFVREYPPVNGEVPKLLRKSVRSHSGEHRIVESVGVCAYYSYTKQLAALNNMEGVELSRCLSDTAELQCDVNKLNRFYRLIEFIRYPFTEDTRTPEEKILHEAMYNIYRRANVNSRYFNELTDCVEIPMCELVSNFETLFTTQDELRQLLEEADFTVQKCVPQGTDEACLCVVYDINMDKNSSSPESDADRSDTEFAHTINNSSNESDWDAAEDTKQEQQQQCKSKEDTDEEEAAAPVEQPTDLFDSGYQKSISNAEWSPQSPFADGVFEEQFHSLMLLDVNDIKDKAIKRAETNTKQMNNKVMTENRVTSPSSSSKKSPQKDSTPGTSDLLRRKRKTRKSDGDDDSLKEDVKSIAQCIMYNSLNKLNVDDEVAEIPMIEPIDLPVPVPGLPIPGLPIPGLAVPAVAIQGLPMPAALPVIEVDLELPFVVENGDLANNNRDNEGNNYPDGIVLPREEVPLPLPLPLEQNANENADDPVVMNPLPVPNQDEQNQNEVAVLRPLVDYEDDEVEEAAGVQVAGGSPQVENLSLNHASREALFDPESQLDMLEDFDLATAASSSAENQVDGVPILVGVNLNPEEHEQVGQHGEEEENHDEPHFYCQGDGLGVHPSIIEVDVEDSSSDTSSNDDAQAERTISDEDVGSLPADGSNVDSNLAVIGHSIDLPLVQPVASNVSNDSADEFFDSLDDNAATGNCPPAAPTTFSEHDHQLE